MNIAIITARGGSKRIPHKNIKKFCDQPIIEYSIQAAKEADIFDTIMVSTDDDEIAKLFSKYLERGLQPADLPKNFEETKKNIDEAEE